MSELLYQELIFDKAHRARGWFTGVFSDEPGEVSEAHSHGEAHLLILTGMVEITLDGTTPLILRAGHEIEIAHNQLHAAVAGPEGFTYAFACPSDEAVRQGLI